MMNIGVRVVLILCFIIISTLSLVACGGATKQASVEVLCDDFMSNKHISKNLEVSVNDSFKATLCSNPTTGFKWVETAQISDITVLQQIGHEFIGPESDPAPPPGTPGQEIWTFKALKKGTTIVTMEYSRPWEGGEKGEWTFNLTISVE
ncbi:protease inhibitor I42 family protein [Chloroflexota bacterium]